VNFDFSDEQKLLKQTARDFLDESCPLERVRETFEGKDSYDAALWRETAGMGWQGAVIPEAYGGSGFGYLELAPIAEELGRALAALPFSSSVYLATEALLLAGSESQKQAYLPRLASGASIGTFALEERRGVVGISGVETRFEDGQVRGAKSPVPDGDVADFAVVTCRESEGFSLCLVDLTGTGVDRARLESFDPSRSSARITFDGAPAERLGEPGEGEALLSRIHDRAAVLLAFEQIGGAQRCLDTAVEFAKGRYAFGRSIGSFQAIKHKLADIFVALELARSNAYYGAWALASDSDELGIAACLARISAIEAYELAAEESLHTHGGAGFTWEYDCHLLLRRAKLRALALGAARRWKHRLVDHLASNTAAAASSQH